MSKKWYAHVFFLLMILCLLMNASCEKALIKSDPPVTATSEEEAALKTKQAAAEQGKKEEMEKRRGIEESTLKEERLKADEEKRQQQQKAERDRFLNEDVYFEYDSYMLLPAAQEVLREKADWLTAHPNASVTIEGHCDERGTGEYNIALGERRAESARTFLINLGIVKSRLRTTSYGEEKPADPSHTEEAWAKNRRAHFVID